MTFKGGTEYGNRWRETEWGGGEMIGAAQANE